MDEGVVACLDKDNKVNFDVDKRNSLIDYFEIFILAHPLEKHLEGTLGVHFIVHHGCKKDGGWSDNYVHFSHEHDEINPTIY